MQGMACAGSAALLVIVGLCMAWALGDETAATPDRSAPDSRRVSVGVARDRATAMHDVYISVLETMHRNYFHENRAVLPARALEEVFKEQAERSGT